MLQVSLAEPHLHTYSIPDEIDEVQCDWLYTKKESVSGRGDHLPVCGAGEVAGGAVVDHRPSKRYRSCTESDRCLSALRYVARTSVL